VLCTAQARMHGKPTQYMYRKGTSRSLLVFLHGFGEGGRVRGTCKYGPLARGSTCPPEIHVVVPICRRLQWWKAREVLAFIDEVAALYRAIDVSVAGGSMGGFAVWKVLSMRPHFFSSAIVVSASLGRIAGLMGVLNSKAVDPRLLCNVTTPVWVLHGKLDMLTSCEDAQDAYCRLLSSQDRRMTCYARTGHSGALRKAFQEENLYAWVLQSGCHEHRRPTPRLAPSSREALIARRSLLA
jgi:pimeloyl-ACP methyl ester carboxylesterase